jgi:membrane associated rhomboid family serine protease
MLSLPISLLEDFIWNYALVPADITAGINYTSLVTSMFLHGSFGHIAGNMLFLYIFGDNLEEAFGHIKFLFFYLLTGLAAAALQLANDPGSMAPMLGASGAVAGVMGGYLVLFPKHRIDIFVPPFIITTVPAYFMLFYWILFQFFMGLGSMGVENGAVAYFAHIGGFFAGVFATLGLLLLNGGVRRRIYKESQPPFA